MPPHPEGAGVGKGASGKEEGEAPKKPVKTREEVTSQRVQIVFFGALDW